MKIVLFVFFSCFLFLNPVFAEILKEKKKEDSLLISGFVDGSYFKNQLHGTSTFSLDQVEVDIVKKIEGKGSVRADLNFIRQEDDPLTITTNESKLSADDIIEQGFASIDKNGFRLRLGKFNAPIGFESLDPVDMYQYSHAMVFDYGLPTNLTGVEFAGTYGIFGISMYWVNGWDKIVDDNNDKTVGGRVTMTPGDGSSIGLSYIEGNETGSGAWVSPEKLSVYDVDLSYSPSKSVIFGFEYNKGFHEKNKSNDPGFGDAEWTGYLLMAHFNFSQNTGMTIRYDTFDDKDGTRFGTGIAERRVSWVVATTFTVWEGFGGLTEYRWVKSDKNVFKDEDGKAVSNDNSFALEVTYSF